MGLTDREMNICLGIALGTMKRSDFKITKEMEDMIEGISEEVERYDKEGKKVQWYIPCDL